MKKVIVFFAGIIAITWLSALTQLVATTPPLPFRGREFVIVFYGTFDSLHCAYEEADDITTASRIFRFTPREVADGIGDYYSLDSGKMGVVVISSQGALEDFWLNISTSSKIPSNVYSLFIRISLIWPFFILTLMLSYRLLRRNKPTTVRCPACGYDLRGTPERCPECGRESSAAEQF